MAAERRTDRLRLFALPIVTVLIAAAGANVGSHGFVRVDQTQDPVPLEPEKAVERGLAGGQSHRYLVTLAAGEAARLTVQQGGIDIGIRVLDTAGKLVLYVDAESRRTHPEHLLLAPDGPVEYSVHVEARYRQEPKASYTIRLQKGPRTVDDQAAFEARRLRIESETLEGRRPTDALEMLTRALTLAEQHPTPDPQFVAELLTRAGEVAATAGRGAEAETFHERAVATADTSLGRDHPQASYARARLGSFYMNQRDDLERAEPLLMEGIAGTERALGSSHPKAVIITNSLALLYIRRGDYDRALPVLQKGFAAAEQSLEEADPLFMQFVNNLGDLHRRMEEFDKAEPYLTRALALMEKASGPDHLRVATPLVNLAVLAREGQNFTRAFELLNRAYAIRTKALGESSTPSAETLVLMANVHHAKGEYGEAIALLEKALATLEVSAGPYHRSTMAALANLARAKAASGDVNASIEYEGRVQRIVEVNLALNLRMTGSERQKLALFDETNRRTDRILSFSNQLAPESADATRLAVEVVLQRKGRVLDAVAGTFAVLRQQLARDSRQLLEDLQTTTSRFAALALNGPSPSMSPAAYEKELRTLEARQEGLEAEISRTSGAFRAATQSATLAAVQKAIPPGAALVEFIKYEPYNPTAREERLAFGEPRYAAYIIRTSGTPIRADLGPAAPIDTMIAELRESLRNPRRTDSKPRARALDRLVMEPVRARIGTEGRLLISPDGALNLVPFETLVDAGGRYAVESYSISYLTSGRDLLRLQVPRQSQSAPVVIADPDFGEPTGGAGGRVSVRSVTSGGSLAATYFAPLSGTAHEARMIQSLYPDATILTGAKATKSALRATTAPAILHIASHGFFLENTSPSPGAPNTRGARASGRLVENPLVRSGIALAQANMRGRAADSGILTALETSSLNLWGTQLVTLSACDTGVGEVRQGEGVYGLRRAFLLAGAESIVMSLWPVSDYVTRQMMQTYYSGLKKGLGRGEALRAAQIDMLRRRPHPFYWGGFIQAGAWGPVRTAAPQSN